MLNYPIAYQYKRIAKSLINNIIQYQADFEKVYPANYKGEWFLAD
jgi:hypothetical protein